MPTVRHSAAPEGYAKLELLQGSSRCTRFRGTTMRRLEAHHPRLHRGESEVRPRFLPAKLGAIAVAIAMTSCSPQSSVPGKSGRAIANSHNDIVRFLEQATFGPTPESIRHLEQDLGGDYNAWLNEQFGMPISNYPDVCCDGSRPDTTCNQSIACGP